MQQISRYSFLVIATILLLDFLIPGQIFREATQDVVREEQRYYNAAGNSHYTYHVRTGQNYFIVNKNFAKSLSAGDTIQYRLSYLFNEINGVKKCNDQQYTRHSMRWFAGMVFPIIAIFFLVLGIRNPKKYGNPIFVVQVLLIADVVYILY